MYLNDVFTVTVNMAGLPGLSVPAGLDPQDLPLGLQLVGRPFDEKALFALGHVIEKAAGVFAPKTCGGSRNAGGNRISPVRRVIRVSLAGVFLSPLSLILLFYVIHDDSKRTFKAAG